MIDIVVRSRRGQGVEVVLYNLLQMAQTTAFHPFFTKNAFLGYIHFKNPCRGSPVSYAIKRL